MRGHTEGTMPMGKDGRGSIISISKKAKSKHKQLDGGKTNWGRRHNVIDAMNKVLTGSTRIWDQREYIISRQHERDVIGKEREEI